MIHAPTCWTCEALIPDPATAPHCPEPDCHAVFCSPGHASIHSRLVAADLGDDVVDQIMAVYAAGYTPG